MGSEWKECLLGDLVELKRGYDLPKKQRIKGSVPIISSSGISDFHADSKVKGPGVVTGRYGTIGEVFYTNKEFWPLNTTLYVKDFKGNDPKFIYYFLKTIPYHLYSDKAAVPGVNRNHLHLAVVKAPACKEEQKKLGQLLEDFDNKIELNRQTNQILEQMAQALFKSWFVDFDPVIDNALAAGNPIPPALAARAERRKSLQEAADNTPQLPEHIRALFPDSFIHHSDRGWIPEGWEITSFLQLATLQTKSVHPNKELGQDWTHYSIPAFDVNCCPTEDSGESIKSGKYRVPKSAVLASKLNPETPRVWMPEICNENTSVCSTEFMPFVPNKANQRAFLYALLCSAPVQTAICDRATGSTGSRQRVKPKEIAEMPILLPCNEIINRFSSQTQPLYEKVQKGLNNNSDLAKLRDTLLPKLISGELRLPDTHQQEPAEQPETITACAQHSF